MAKPPKSRFSSLLNTIAGRYSSSTLKPIDPKIFTPSQKVISDTERDKLLMLSSRTTSETPQTGYSAVEYFKNISQQLASERIENDRIIQMAPEISLAASIMIPSIMAPNDLREDAIPITCTVEGDDAKSTELTEYATTFFEEKFHFSTSVPEWIYEAMYRSGAKPLMIIPLSTLYEKLTDKTALVAGSSLESLRIATAILDKESLYGFGDDAAGVNRDKEIEHIALSTESFSLSAIESVAQEQQKEQDKKIIPSTNEKRKLSSKYREFVTDVLSTEKLTVTDNADSINIAKQRNKRAKNKVSNTIRAVYKEAAFQTIPESDADKDPMGAPIFMELPTEAVIPIYTPGTPSDHIGYFIILDEFGNPLSVQDYTANNFQSAADAPTQTNFSQMFTAYGYDFSNTSDAQKGQNTIANIYQNIVETHLKDRASKAGFADISLGSDSSIYRCMFTRYLQQRRTRILFVPKEFLTYFCFKHSENGTGVSKLDELKFILSLRISLLVSRMLSAFRNALDRKVLNINFSENFVGNPLEVMRTAERESIRKDAISFSSNPQDIAQQIASKSYTVKVTGIKGTPDFSVGKDADERSASVAPPDTELADDIKNLEVLGLEIPPAALNSLNDAEFSRSIATTNIIFSRKLVGYQNRVEKHMDSFIRTYAMFNKEFREKVGGIIKEVSNDLDKSEKGSYVDKRKKISVDEVINTMHFTLPSPNIAPDSSQFDSVNSMITAFTSITDTLMSDDLAGDDPVARTIYSGYKALARSKVVRQYLQKIGMTDIDFPDVNNMNIDDLLRFKQILANAAKGFKDQDALFKPDPNADAGDGLGGDQTPDAFGADNTDTTSDFGAGDDSGLSDTPDDTSTPPDDTTGGDDAGDTGGLPNADDASGTPPDTDTSPDDDSPSGRSLV